MYEIRDSKIHERGVFATQIIRKGTEIMEITGEKIDEKETLRREIENLKKGSTYIFTFNEEYSIDGEVFGNESRYINHSCDPNCEVMGDDEHLILTSIKNIMPGDELTIDYAFPRDEDISTKCFCGSEICRGYIEECLEQNS
jgi:uncharacterized protein